MSVGQPVSGKSRLSHKLLLEILILITFLVSENQVVHDQDQIYWLSFFSVFLSPVG